MALKADGSLKATSKTASTEEFGTMSDYVKETVTKAAEESWAEMWRLRRMNSTGEAAATTARTIWCADLTRGYRGFFLTGSWKSRTVPRRSLRKMRETQNEGEETVDGVFHGPENNNR